MIKRIYETERLELRVLTPEFASVVLEFYKKNERFLMPWESQKPQGFYTDSFQTKMLELEEDAFLKGHMVRYWLFLKNNLSYAIGSVSLTNITRGAFQSCYLGYKLDENWTGKGYMTEALTLVTEIAFKAYGLHRIEATVMPRNIKSLALLKRLDFRNEGLSKSYLKINDVWEDHYRMVKLNENML